MEDAEEIRKELKDVIRHLLLIDVGQKGILKSIEKITLILKATADGDAGSGNECH